ncbi:MAG TPA: trigger factor, partial [Candidatus Limnocylindria bacterium]|nr:trigger factor [Candidatus Limnocylindria bacterium]
MTYQAEKISGNQTRIHFTIPADEFEAAVQQAYLKQRSRINVPGFRRGKAPRKLMENMFGASIFHDEAFDQLFPEAYDKALEEQDIFAVDQPSVEVEQIGPGQELKFTATVYVKPEVTLGDYKGLKAVKHVHPVPQEQIDARIARDAEKVTLHNDVTDRPLQMGDTADIDYLGSVDGVPFEGGEGKGHKLRLGSGSFIPGFEEQLAGMRVGDEKEITVTFPEEYHEASLSGKQAQ